MLEAKSLRKAVIPSSLFPHPSPGHLQSTRLAIHVHDRESLCSVFVASGCHVYNVQVEVNLDDKWSRISTPSEITWLCEDVSLAWNFTDFKDICPRGIIRAIFISKRCSAILFRSFFVPTGFLRWLKSFRGIARDVRDGFGSLQRRSFEVRLSGHRRGKSQVSVHGLHNDPSVVQQSRWARLPPQLLRNVIKRLEASESIRPSQKHVVACASICSSWREMCEEIVKTLEFCGKLTLRALEADTTFIVQSRLCALSFTVLGVAE